ncbi:hypothetical protein CO038_00270 [Candidatus Pacearchaeota archaeon CG_4_9_14_0_2_um_filter_39_13]|nr:NUDIX domain-containing protein [Candidatus Pacearchaeota archaeon]OIO44025.1 MAG: hypothetical protein AUJ64_00985 [Candidatus Pacearchaeota archaeon CG1_02_39_14]PJC45109.1 MAG: hypothetical protein CO038_00270 [Candidatus Pacearchaeota archaeon CG_4_9_14_0_2_um_filter_39_13]
MPKTSSGLLMYKLKDSKLYFFIVHPGGPFWKGKDKGAWSISKGEIDDRNYSHEAMLENARRELKEEVGVDAPMEEEKYIYLGEITQKSGKVVHAWAFEGDFFLLQCTSFAEIEWPPKSGKKIKFPEVDKAGFFMEKEAMEKINPAQIPFVDRLKNYLKEANKI